MSYNKSKIANRYKKYTLIVGALMNFGEMNAEGAADYIGVSLSTASKALRTLCEMGLLNSSRSRGSVYYSPAERPCAVVIDISDNNYTLHVMNSLGRAVVSKTYRHDDRYFTDENLSFFLKSCALMLANENCNELPLHLIADGNFALKYKNAQDSYNPVAPVLAKYFDLKKATVSTLQSCIEYGAKHLAGCDGAIVFTLCRERILMSYVTDSAEVSLSPVRSIDSRDLIPSEDTVKTAAALACAVGNTVSLLKIKHIVFDCCDVFNRSEFIPSFISALEKYTGGGSSDVKITRMSYSLRLGGAVFACHRRYLSLIQDYED